MALPVHEELLKLWWNQTREHALMFLDEHGVIVSWGGEAEMLFGYQSNEVIGRNVEMLFTPEDVASGAPVKEREVANSGAAAEDDRWMRRRDGSRFWASGVLYGLYGASGALMGYAKILRNRTDAKGHLESQKRENRRLQAHDERKNKFITTLAHELRNPLAALGMAAEILKLGAEDAEGREFAVSTIERQVEFSRRLIEDLLDLTRIERGKLRLQLVQDDLCVILGRSVGAVKQLIKEKRQTLHSIIGNDSIDVLADADRLQQVFVNLLQNAAKYTHEEGEIWLKLFLEGKEAVVKIEDNGIGIATDVLPRIFDLFAQAESGKEHAAGGLGIGLSVVKDLVRLHGGTVQVRSDGVGRGSAFTVRLPLAGDDRKRPDDPSPRS